MYSNIGFARGRVKDICVRIHVGNLSNVERFSLLFRHVDPPTTFPTTFSHGSHRRFNVGWFKKYPWLRYSLKLNAVFCGPCAVLLPDGDRKDKGVLVNRPFSNWVQFSNALTKHSV